MKSLFSKILLSLIVTVLIALAFVVLTSRISMNKGMVRFIERQEAAQLSVLAPELALAYQANGSWEFLRNSPGAWNRLFRIMRLARQEIEYEEGLRTIDSDRARPQRPPPRARPGERGQPGGRRPPPHRGGPEEELNQDTQRPPPRDRQAGNFRARLFLLDENRSLVAGAPYQAEGEEHLEAVVVEGVEVGWLGFVPLRSALPPEARLFLRGQLRALVVSLVIALLVAFGLGYLLARHFGRPLQHLTSTVDELSGGHYDARAEVSTRDEIGHLAKGVNELAESLSSHQTMRRRWMADVAHELRTPVAILKGEIEAIQDGLRPVDGNTLASLNEEADHLARLVDDLQTLALSDAGALDFQMKSFDMAELVRQQLQAFDNRLRERGLNVETEIPERLKLRGDAQRIRQLLHNLLENCCRYTESEGRVVLKLQREDRDTVLTIDDSGPGLTQEQLGQLFDRFYRADGSRARSKGGSGLGMSICRNIAEAHRGSIGAESSPIGGLRIRVQLPGGGV